VSKVQAIVRAPRTVRLWRAARVVALAALAALLVTLWVAPGAGLAVVWGAAIPFVATSLFVTPVLWRGVCPLATLNEVGNRFGRPTYPGSSVQWALGVTGLVLFHLLVPGRLALFNHSGTSVAGAALAIGVLALLLGARFSVRSAFCNALCPILPIERLYGQAPLLDLERGRCGACTVCTPRGCLDLAGTKNVAQLMGPGRRTDAWLLTPFGLFAAALPGFIVGYFLSPNEPGVGLTPWAWTGAGSAASAVVVGSAVRLTRASAARALPILAWASGSAYFAFTGPAIGRLWGWPPGVGVGIAVVGVLFVALWALRAIRRAPAGTFLPDR